MTLYPVVPVITEHDTSQSQCGEPTGRYLLAEKYGIGLHPEDKYLTLEPKLAQRKNQGYVQVQERKKNIGGETGFSETLEFPMQRDLGITEATRLWNC